MIRLFLLASLLLAAAAPSHHREEGGFHNPYVDDTKQGFWSFIAWRLTRPAQPGPDQIEAVSWQHADREAVEHPGADPQITWIGHATLLVQYRGINLLTDPMFSDRASPVSWAGPTRLHPPALTLDELPTIDIVVISHNHYDHLDRTTVHALGNGPIWLVPLGVKEWFLDEGIDHVIELDWWESWTHGETTITCTPAQHWSKRSLWNAYATLWASWAIDIADFSLFFVGDTGYNPVQFAEIGERLGPFDLAALPIGGYEPRWFMERYHITPDEALTIHQEVRAKQSIGIQWGTFFLTDEPLDEPPQRLRNAMELIDLSDDQFLVPDIGETIIIDLD